jgi:hypothetical protein
VELEQDKIHAKGFDMNNSFSVTDLNDPAL